MLGFDALGELSLGQLPAPTQQVEDATTRRALLIRGISFWKGFNVRSSVPRG